MFIKHRETVFLRIARLMDHDGIGGVELFRHVRPGLTDTEVAQCYKCQALGEDCCKGCGYDDLWNLGTLCNAFGWDINELI